MTVHIISWWIIHYDSSSHVIRKKYCLNVCCNQKVCNLSIRCFSPWSNSSGTVESSDSFPFSISHFFHLWNSVPQKNPNCMLIVTPKGGHLGWVAGAGAPRGAPWTDPIVMDFLQHLEQARISTAVSSASLNDFNSQSLTPAWGINSHPYLATKMNSLEIYIHHQENYSEIE